MGHHMITAEIEVRFRPAGLMDMERGVMTAEIEYAYTPGFPATGPNYYSGGEPGAGAEVEFIRATLIDGSDLGFVPDGRLVAEWCADWLDDDGYDIACRLAEDESGPDPDAAYDRKRDERLER